MDGSWELFVVIVVDWFVLFVVRRLSSFSVSFLNTWLRDKLIRRFRLVRLRSRNGFNEDDEDDKKNGTDNGWVSSVDAGWGEGFDSIFIDDYL